MTVLQDLRQALRLMRRAPGFTSAALATMALAIGANTAVFSVVNGVLLRRLPYPRADRLVVVSEEHPGGTALVREPRLSDLTFHAWRGRAQTIERVSGYSTQMFTVSTGPGEAERIDGASVAPSLFPMLGAAPAIGRFFLDEEAVQGRDGIVVLSDSFWRSRFGSDPRAIGRTMQIAGTTREIVGVAPSEFYFPDRDTQFWTPYVTPPNDNRSMSLMSVLARLAPGATLQQAAAEGTSAARSVTRPMAAELLFGKGGPVEVRVRTLGDQITRRVRPALIVLMSAVGLVLFIACANVANLLLARGTSRARELAVRAALGAGATRLAGHLLTESLTIGVAGGALGVLLAWTLTKAVPAWAPEGFPRVDDVRLDVRVLGFAVVVSLAAGIFAGLLPALRASRADVSPVLRGGDSRITGSGERVRSVLLAIEAALSVMLLIGAALLLRSFVALLSVDPGYNPSHVLTGRVYLTGAPATDARRVEIVRMLTQRLQSTPGVVAAGAGNMAPLGESSFISAFSFGTNAAGQEVVAHALQYVVTSGYAEALGLHLEEGRLLTAADETAPIQAVLVNESFARTYITAGRPVVGRRYQGLLADKNVTTEIVGVIGNVRKDGLDGSVQPEIYLAHTSQRRISREINLVIRIDGAAAAFAPTLRSLVRDVEPSAALGRVRTLDSQIADSVSQPRFATAILTVFAVIALAIAATGLYGVLSYNVSQRRREIAIRSALGATRANVIGLVLRQGLGVTVVGLAGGLLLTLLAVRQVTPLLFGIEPLDVPSFVVMPLILLAVALVACAIPARRAAATDPASVLRSE